MNILRCVILVVLAGCASAVPSGSADEVDAVLDRWHRAASEADEGLYFGTLAPDAVFLGTDATERWTRSEFEADMMRYFERESAWTYVPVERHVSFSADGRMAWFDERLENESYGECRGTGVLRRDAGGAWKIVQYNLTIPIPNAIAKDVVQAIRVHEKSASDD